MKCVKCGSELKPGARFCSKCGAVNGPAKKPSPGRIQPASPANRPFPEAQVNYTPAQKKEKKPVALIVVLIVLIVCLVLSVGGFAAYRMGVFDSFLSGSRTEDTDSKKSRKDRDKDDEDEDDDRDRDRDDDDEDEDRDRDEDDEDEDRDRDDEDQDRDEDDGADSGGQGNEDSGELPAAAEESAVNSTMPATEPATAAAEAPTMAQTTAAMPTLAGQGAGMAVPTQAAPAQGGVPANGDYILPDSSTRRLTAADISGLTKDQLRIARNEVYARHGRMFNSEELQNYFNSKSWYRGTISASSFSENLLSQLEKDNIKLIQERENALP